MKITLTVSILFVLGTITDVSAATKNIFLGKNLCSDNQVVCFKGSMEFNYSIGRLEAHGRIKQSTKPGRLKIRMRGSSNNGKEFYATVSTSLQGNYSELFKAESKTNRSLKGNRDIRWQIESIRYR